MRRMTWLIGGCVGAGLLLGACGGAPAATTAPVPAATTAPAAAVATAPPSPTTAPTATPPPATATVAPTATPAPAATKPAAATELPPGEAARAARTAFSRVTSYRLTGVVTPKEGGQMNMSIEYVAPDRMRMVMKGSDASQNMEMVVIANTTYMNVAGNWTKLEGGMGGAGGMNVLQTLDIGELMKEMEGGTLTRSGVDVVDGEPCVVYDYTQTDGSGKVWVGVRDNLVRKIEGKDKDSTFTMTITDINKPIEIKAPI